MLISEQSASEARLPPFTLSMQGRKTVTYYVHRNVLVSIENRLLAGPTSCVIQLSSDLKRLNSAPRGPHQISVQLDPGSPFYMKVFILLHFGTQLRTLKNLHHVLSVPHLHHFYWTWEVHTTCQTTKIRTRKYHLHDFLG